MVFLAWCDANQDGIVDVNSRPNNEDTDGDGIMDGWEDTNRNGIRINEEVRQADSDDMVSWIIEDADLNGICDVGVVLYLDDTDGDGVSDGVRMPIRMVCTM